MRIETGEVLAEGARICFLYCQFQRVNVRVDLPDVFIVFGGFLSFLAVRLKATALAEMKENSS